MWSCPHGDGANMRKEFRFCLEIFIVFSLCISLRALAAFDIGILLFHLHRADTWDMAWWWQPTLWACHGTLGQAWECETFVGMDRQAWLSTHTGQGLQGLVSVGWCITLILPHLLYSSSVYFKQIRAFKSSTSTSPALFELTFGVVSALPINYCCSNKF